MAKSKYHNLLIKTNLVNEIEKLPKNRCVSFRSFFFLQCFRKMKKKKKKEFAVFKFFFNVRIDLSFFATSVVLYFHNFWHIFQMANSESI